MTGTLHSPERWAKTQEIFLEALEREPSERGSFIDTMCEGDPHLRDEVRSLLSAHDAGGPVADPMQDLSTSFGTSLDRVGPYQIVEELGRGGMGTVFLAEREGVGFTQRVALKVMRIGFADPVITRRLSGERRILAKLEHPSIARFVDGGTTPAGQHYVAMEYVEGVDFLTYCTSHDLTIAERLTVFLDICDAVQYAHQQLVVHRDLKPSNILVDSSGRVKLLDFGIAKVLDAEEGSPDTQTGAWFTPAYASPEQIRRAGVSTLSDVYTLGVLLYEVLTGSKPYAVESPSPAEIERIVCTVEPPRPSDRVDGRTTRLLRGDLDTITMKALAKEPSRRYASVAELGDDIRRHLAREPVLARPASTGYRLSKFVRRHRLAVSASALVIVSLIAGAVFTIWQAGVAERERERAEQAALRSAGVSDFLIDLFRVSDIERDLNPSRELLRRGVEQAEALSGDVAVQAQMFDALGRAYHNLQEYQEAHRLLIRALQIRESLYPEGHQDLARTMNAFATTLGNLTLRDSALMFLERALAMGREQFSEADPFIAGPLLALGRRASFDRRYEEAESYFTEALAVFRAADPADPRVAQPMMDLAALKRRQQDFAAAQQYYVDAIAHYRRTSGPDHPDVGQAMYHYADMYVDDLGIPHLAIPILREGLAIVEHALGPDHVLLTHGLNSLGYALAGIGEHAEAEAAVRRVVAIHRSLFGEHHIGTAREREQLAGVLLLGGKTAEAETIYQDVIRIKRDILGDATVHGTFFSLARAQMTQGDFLAAEESAREGLEIRRRIGVGQSTNAASNRFFGELYLATGDLAAAERWLNDADEILTQLGETTSETEHLYSVYIDLYERMGNFERANLYRDLLRRLPARVYADSI